MKGFNLPASFRYSAEELRFVLKFVLTAAHRMRKTAANEDVALPSNTVPT